MSNNSKFSLGQVTTGQMLGLMLLAYLFSFAIRLIWVWQFQDSPNFIWENQLMINTNDGYFFASGAQQELEGLHSPNPRVFGMWDYGVIFFTTLFVKITPFSLETIILYMPSIISSLVVIPMILIARLYKQTLWGFFAALLGSIAWSYYNRTMTGYYDTDMFSAMAPMIILYFLIKSTIDFNLRTGLYAAISIAIYPFLYDSGLSIVYAIGMIYAIYMIVQHPKENTTYLSLILVFVSLLPFPFGSPYSYILKIMVLVALYLILKRVPIEQKRLMIITGLVYLLFLITGNVFGLILGKVFTYIATGTSSEGLHFYSVAQTVREAGDIPFSTFANRTSGSVVGVIIALAGYLLLVKRHNAFILALPLIGIGIFSLWGGLRFTVYAVPVAAMSAVYLFFYLAKSEKIDNPTRLIILVGASLIFFLQSFIGMIEKFIVPEVRGFFESTSLLFTNLIEITKQTFKTGLNSSYVEYYQIYIFLFVLIAVVIFSAVSLQKKYKTPQLLFVSILTFLIITPNITHIINYKVPTVLTKAEVEDLTKLNEIADAKDYTLSWWDYGYPIWYYSDTSTLIDGGKHNNDNFIVSKIMFSTSPEEVANLSRLSVETYVDSNYAIVVDKMFKDKNPNRLLNQLKKSDFKLPKKTREVFLYMPKKMLRIFPTVGVFSNINLKTGNKKRKITFYPARVVGQNGGVLKLNNGIILDLERGKVLLGAKKVKIRNFDTVTLSKDSKTHVDSQTLNFDGELNVIYMARDKQIIVLDTKTYNSAYVQMYMLGRYDKNLFELVVSSPYSKIYRVKK